MAVAHMSAEIPDREYLRETARLIEARLPDNYGFICLAFPFGEGGRLFYTSNARREDAVAALKEWLIQAGGEEEWMRHIK
jgi:hypothetical protein